MAKIKSSDENVFLMVGDNKSPGYEYTIPTKTINTGTTDTVNCGTIHTVAYDANGGTYGKDAAGNDIPGPEDMTKYYYRTYERINLWRITIPTDKYNCIA